VFTPDWGETFTGKRDPSLVVVNLDNYEIKVLDRFQGNMSPGQVSNDEPATFETTVDCIYTIQLWRNN